MDPLSDMLGGIRAEGVCVNQVALEPPWSVRFAPGASLTLLSAVKGGGVLILADGTVSRLRPGDTALVRDARPFHLVDAAATLASSIEPLAGNGYQTQCDLGIEETTADTVVIVGSYDSDSTRQRRLLETLPPVLTVSDDGEELFTSALVDALRYRLRAGGQALIDRVVDWGLVCVLAQWFDRQGPAAPAWYRGATDPVVGPVLDAIHKRPRHLWTVAGLAAEARVSRAHLAKRFTEVMGQPPLRYLTDWRMCTAEELLADAELSVAAVAAAVGYADPFAFSTAFKRHCGLSPRDYRSTVASAA